MRTTLLTLFTCLLLLCCKKREAEGWHGTITATINGVDTTFNYYINSSYGSSSTSGTWGITTSGYKEPGGDRIFIDIRNKGEVVPGVYAQTDSVNYAYLDYSQKGVHFSFMSSGTSVNPAVVTINSVSDNQIQGTFSGDVYLLEYVNGSFYFTTNKKEIRNGKFDVRLR